MNPDIYQGKTTLKLLEDLGIAYYVLSSDSTEDEVGTAMDQFASLFKEGKQAAFVIRKGALAYAKSEKGQSNPTYPLSRERAIELLVNAVGDGFVVSTTGKASRVLFEIRERLNQGYGHDFLTVGSMGHASSIALGLALQREDKRFWVFDGDGALLMHMGAMPVIGSQSPKNLIHVVLNNGTHDTVGGQPTCMPNVKLLELASACGYSHVLCAKEEDALLAALNL